MPTPSKNLERDLSAESYIRYVKCTARLDPAEIKLAYLAAWQWSNEMAGSLTQRHNFEMPDNLIEKIDRLMMAESRNIKISLRD